MEIEEVDRTWQPKSCLGAQRPQRWGATVAKCHTLVLCGAIAVSSCCGPAPQPPALPPPPPPAGCQDGWICPRVPIYASKIGAWYSLGWIAQDTPRCGDGFTWSGSRYKPVRGFYTSSDPATISAQMNEMHQAGIDFLILDFTNGFATGTTNLGMNMVYAAGYAVRDYDNSSSPGVHLPFAAAIGAHLWSDRNPTAQQSDADRVYTDFFAQGNNANYMTWKGKPLLINYNAFEDPCCYRPDWADTRFSVGRAAANLTPDSQLEVAAGSAWWGWAAAWPTFVSKDVMTVAPGADNLHRCDGAGHAHLDRNGLSTAGACMWTQTTEPPTCSWSPSSACPHDPNTPPQPPSYKIPGMVDGSGTPGLLFELEWLRAIKTNPSAIIIASYNEFGDETAIEPAVLRTDSGAVKGGVPWKDYYGTETPTWYLQIAAAYAALRTGLAKDTYYRDEDSPAVYQVSGGRLVYQSSAPHQKPVILLPAGTLAAMLGASPVSVPPDGTLLTSGTLAPALIVGRKALQFEVRAVATQFAISAQEVSAAAYWSLPYAGAIHAGTPAYGTTGFPPAFESDMGELWPVSCASVSPITANGSEIYMTSASYYASFAMRSPLRCVSP